MYITLAYTYTHTFGASLANGLIPSIFRLVNDETSPSMGKTPRARPRALEVGAVFWRCKQLLQSLVAPLSLQGLVPGPLWGDIVTYCGEIGDENWPLEGHLRRSVLFKMFIICTVFRRYLPLFAIFTNLRTDKSLRTI